MPTVSPATITGNDPSAAELGVKFQVTTCRQGHSGFAFTKVRKTRVRTLGICGVRQERCSLRLLSPGETASGWQQANFSTPVTVTAGTTYVVSYHSSGFYSADGNYFVNALTSGPLTAPSSASGGGNGVYAYGSTSVFPTSTYNAANYWVDVAFAAAGPLGNQPPTANNDSGFITSENTALAIPASALLANDTDPNGFCLVDQRR